MAGPTATTPAGWYQADSLGLNDGDAVGTWTDSSGSGRDVTQGTAGAKPLFKTNIQNGLPIVRFDGTDDWLAGTGFGTLNQPISMYTVTKITSGGTCHICLGDFGGDRARWDTFSGGGGHPSLNGGTALAMASPPVSVGFHQVSYIFNGASSEIRVDTGSVATGNGGTGSGGTLVAIGATSNGFPTGAEFSAGDIGEIILYNAVLSADEQGQVEQYLSNKWFPSANTTVGVVGLAPGLYGPGAEDRGLDYPG